MNFKRYSLCAASVPYRRRITRNRKRCNREKNGCRRRRDAHSAWRDPASQLHGGKLQGRRRADARTDAAIYGRLAPRRKRTRRSTTLSDAPQRRSIRGRDFRAPLQTPSHDPPNGQGSMPRAKTWVPPRAITAQDRVSRPVAGSTGVG